MKNRLLLKLFAFAVIVGMAFTTSCKDYDDDINRLSNENSTLKTELAALSKKVDETKTELNNAINDKIKTVTDEITALKAQLKTLEENSATKAELDAVKKEILEKTVSLEVFNTYKGEVAEELKDLKDGLEKAATKVELAATQEQLDALEDTVTAFKLHVLDEFLRVEGLISTLDLKVDNLETTLRGEITQLGKDLRKELSDAIAQEVLDRNKAIEDLKNELEPRIKTLEGILDVKDGKSLVIADIYNKLKEHTDLLKAHADSITALRNDMDSKYNELVKADEELQRQITDNKNAITAIQKYIKNELEPRLKGIEDDIKELQGRMTNAEEAIQLNISNILTLSRQLKGLTFIPTRGLPAEKTMKFYYFAGDYSANHMLMYRVNPSNAKLGRDFTIESLNYQITTRSASDGVEDGSEKVSVKINGEVTQEGDIIYVPVHVEGPAACDVFGNHDWWCNEFYFGSVYGLSPDNFPAHVVKTVKSPNVQYSCGNQNRGLSLVLTALTTSVEENPEQPVQVYVKSSEMMNTELVPTQIKLAESRDGKGNQILDANLKERLLNFTLAEATEWAKKDESSFPNHDKNWNVQAWSGNENPDGWIPGSFDLNNYVTSFYYPQDGGDLSRKDVVPGDPHRYLWAEFGKEFGTPYTDKPNYAKPIYEYELVAYEDGNHNIIIGTPASGSTHDYVSIEGSIISVHKTAVAIQGVRNKKVIVKVTQVNSECPERQPVGYLVIKYTDKPVGKWDDVNFTYDMTNLPYYHKECKEFINGARIIKKDSVNTSSHGITFTHKDANLNLFTEDRFMSPINSPQSYGISSATMNPGDIDHVIGEFPQINGIGEWSMGNIYNIQGQHVSIVPGSRKFTAATNNHVNDTENEAATGVTAEQALSHVMIRYEYSNHAYIIYVDDHAPAGDYEVTYELENKVGNTQHGNVLYLTFKFRVALRDITVEHDKNTVNWLDDNKTIRVQHTRITNTIDEGHSPFRSDDGYRVDLREAFILKDGTIDIVTDTKPAIDGRNVGKVPSYNPKFEFIQDAKIKAAGFKYERDANNYLTRITLNGELAARIENDPADGFNYLYIKFNKAGDMLYNYLMQDMLASNDLTKHNVWTKWGKTELMKFDDMERLLPVRLVTDINATCADKESYKFPNGNYYYIDDFNIKFERALRWAFTTVEMTDNQRIQGHFFDFFTKDVHATDETKSVYRGVFDHAYDLSHGYGNLVHPRWEPGMSLTPYTFTNPFAQAWFYGLNSAPLMLTDDVLHPFEIDNVLGDYATSISGSYHGLDHSKVEVSTDGGNTWKPADQDYSVLAHNKRYFNVIQHAVYVNVWWWSVPVLVEVPVAIWQGNQTAITSPIYFRVPVTNYTAMQNGLNTDGNYWIGFRAGSAKVKGYAVFKINPRP